MDHGFNCQDGKKTSSQTTDPGRNPFRLMGPVRLKKTGRKNSHQLFVYPSFCEQAPRSHSDTGGCTRRGFRGIARVRHRGGHLQCLIGNHHLVCSMKARRVPFCQSFDWTFNREKKCHNGAALVMPLFGDYSPKGAMKGFLGGLEFQKKLNNVHGGISIWQIGNGA